MRNGLFAKSRPYLALHKRTRTPPVVGHQQDGFQNRQGRPRPWNRSIYRGIHSRTTVSLSELQNEAPGPSNGPPGEDINGKTYPTVVLQALKNMEKHESCVLLTRVGSFYEVTCSVTPKWSLLMHSAALFRSGREIWPAAQPQSSKEEDC